MKRILISVAALALTASLAAAGGIGGGTGSSGAAGGVSGGTGGGSAIVGITQTTTTATQQAQSHNDTTGWGVGGTALVGAVTPLPGGGVAGGIGVVSGGAGGVETNSDQNSGGQSVTTSGSLGFAGSGGQSGFGGTSGATGTGGGIGFGF